MLVKDTATLGFVFDLQVKTLKILGACNHLKSPEVSAANHQTCSQDIDQNHFPSFRAAGPAAQGFDNKMFGIAEAEAQAMDPHQRILPLATRG